MERTRQIPEDAEVRDFPDEREDFRTTPQFEYISSLPTETINNMFDILNREEMPGESQEDDFAHIHRAALLEERLGNRTLEEIADLAARAEQIQPTMNHQELRNNHIQGLRHYLTDFYNSFENSPGTIDEFLPHGIGGFKEAKKAYAKELEESKDRFKEFKKDYKESKDAGMKRYSDRSGKEDKQLMSFLKKYTSNPNVRIHPDSFKELAMDIEEDYRTLIDQKESFIQEVEVSGEPALHYSIQKQNDVMRIDADYQYADFENKTIVKDRVLAVQIRPGTKKKEGALFKKVPDYDNLHINIGDMPRGWMTVEQFVSFYERMADDDATPEEQLERFAYDNLHDILEHHKDQIGKEINAVPFAKYS